MQPQGNRILVRVVNTSPTPVTLYKNSKVATMYLLREDDESSRDSDDEIFEVLEPVSLVKCISRKRRIKFLMR